MKKLDINHPVRIERRMKLAHFLGLIELEQELWLKLKSLSTSKNK